MGKTDRHMDVMTYCKEALRAFFANRAEEVYVSGNNFIYYREGSPKKVVSPDVYVVFGVPQRQRDTFKVWEEGGHLPSVVIEITSRATQREDVGKKLDLYEKTLRIPEYFLYDPTGEWLRPRLAGYRLDATGEYQPLPLSGERMRSEELGLIFVTEDDRLRLYDPRTGAFLLSADEERQRADAAEAKIARLRAEIENLRRRSQE